MFSLIFWIVLIIALGCAGLACWAFAKLIAERTSK